MVKIQTPKPRLAKPLAGFLGAKTPAPKKPGDGKDLSDEQRVLAFIDSLSKGDEILKRVRSKVLGKLAQPDIDPELVELLTQAADLKSWESLKTAFSVVRKKYQPVKRKEEAESS